MKLLFFPNGTTVNLDQVTNIGLVGNTFTFTLAGSSTPVTFVSSNPQLVLSEIASFASSSGGSFTSSDIGTTCYLTSVNPTNILCQVGATITVYGQNFDSGTLGTIHIEDASGGLDDNGVTFTPTLVSSTELTAVWNSNGDSTFPAVLFYYRDSNGVATNVLTVNAHT